MGIITLHCILYIKNHYHWRKRWGLTFMYQGQMAFYTVGTYLLVVRVGSGKMHGLQGWRGTWANCWGATPNEISEWNESTMLWRWIYIRVTIVGHFFSVLFFCFFFCLFVILPIFCCWRFFPFHRNSSCSLRSVNTTINDDDAINALI